MARTKGSLNKPKAVVLDAVKSDGYSEAFTGAGTNRDRSSFAKAKSAYLLQSSDVVNLYLADGFARKVVDIPAEEMTRAGIELEDIEDETLEKNIESKLQELDALKYMNDAIRWSRLFGGALLIYGVNDGGTLEVPLNVEGIKDVEFLRVYDRTQATIQCRVLDTNSPYYGDVELWLISPVDGGQPYIVHNSRCHIFDGESIPDILRNVNQGWGASALQACYDQLIRLGMSHQWANMLLERSQQAVHKIPELANTLRSPGGEALIQKRVDVVDMVRGILNTIVIDGMEDYTVSSQSMAGLPDVLDRFAEALSAVSNIPVMLLMGRSDGGLSGTGKGELDSWYARVESMQNDILRKPIDRLVTYILKSMSMNIEYCLKFKPLTVKSDKEKAETEKLEADAKKIKAETAVAYVGIGALDANEVRAGLEEEYEVTGTLAPLTVEDFNADADNLDSVDLAMSHLNMVKQVVQNNQPINAANGNKEQAQLEGEVNASVSEALIVLENYLKNGA